jgi:hypothetical protein
MKIFRDFLITSALFIAAPLPLAASLTFKVGGWHDASRVRATILATDERSMVEGLDRNFAEGPPRRREVVHGTIGRAPEELSTQLLSRGIRWAGDHRLISIVHTETAEEVEDALRAGEHLINLNSLGGAELGAGGNLVVRMRGGQEVEIVASPIRALEGASQSLGEWLRPAIASPPAPATDRIPAAQTRR